MPRLGLPACLLLADGLGAFAQSGLSVLIDTRALLREMATLRHLADFPQPVYRTVQFSSYDRRSSVPGGPDWFANSDGFGGEPIPGFEAVVREPGDDGIGEYLVCDVQEPGAIVRTWTADIRGDLRVVLDRSDTPLYDGPAQDFLRCPYRALRGATEDSDGLDDTFIQHEAAYCPIPFARGCRITWTGKLSDIHFYHVNVRLYEPAAAVRTFTPADLTANAAEIRRVARILANPDKHYEYTSQREPLALDARAEPGRTAELLVLEGPAALERLTLKLAAGDLDRALRQTILHIHCDGWPHGQVESPLGDFFGAAPGINPFDSLPFTVRGDGTMTCRFPMPFRKSLKIRIENRGPESVHVMGAALPMDYAWDNKRSMHFRARWRVDHDIRASNAGEDIPFLLTHGRGVYVGTAIMLLNPTPLSTPWGSWWGEGDEKIFIDADERPSTFGTGSEDYFNYAWSIPDIFTLPYCGQPRNDGPGNRGFVANYRWHILDPLPFRERIAFYLELMSHDRTPGMSYARLAYHYGRPGLIDDHRRIRGADVRHLELPANWQPAPRFAVKDAVFHQAEDLTPAGPHLTLAEGRLWAGGKLLVWRPAKIGDELPLRFNVPNEGVYALHLALRHDDTAGVVSFRLDGEPLHLDGRERLDLYAPYRVLLRQYATPNDEELAAGEHTLTIVAEGASSARERQHAGADARPGGQTVGIDYLAVQPKPKPAQP
ncbi:MAG: DUF2961 domain-containing protein [Planctomycetota bacterium]